MSSDCPEIQTDFRNLKETFNSLCLLAKLAERQLLAQNSFLSEMRTMGDDRKNFGKTIQVDLAVKLREFLDTQRRYCDRLLLYTQAVGEQLQKAKKLIKAFQPTIKNISKIIRLYAIEGHLHVLIVSEVSKIAQLAKEEDLALSQSDWRLSNDDNFLSYIQATFAEMSKMMLQKFNELEHKASLLAYYSLLCSKVQNPLLAMSPKAFRNEVIEDLTQNIATLTLRDKAAVSRNHVRDSKPLLLSEIENQFRVSHYQSQARRETISSPKAASILMRTSKKSSANIKDRDSPKEAENVLISNYHKKEILSTPSKSPKTEWATLFQFSFVNTAEAGNLCEMSHKKEKISSSKFYQPHYKSLNDSYSAKCKAPAKDIQFPIAKQLGPNAETEDPQKIAELPNPFNTGADKQFEATRMETFYIKTPFFFGSARGSGKNSPRAPARDDSKRS